MGNNKMIGIIYYTDNRVLNEPIYSICQRFIKEAELPITSCSLKPIDFGNNFVLKGRQKGAYTMILQIIMALENSEADYVFFCEHDVLYHKTHFDFIPLRDDVYYYNTNNRRWRFHTEQIITYDNLSSLSSLCCNRKLALEHFKLRKKFVEDNNLDMELTKEPSWSRKMGYEPGSMDKRNGGFEIWRSKFPNIDIRHCFCFTNRKTRTNEYARTPENWIESTIDKIPGWDLKTIHEKSINLH